MAGGIRVTVSVDSKGWEAGIANLIDLLYLATGDASMDAAETVGAIAKAKLTEKQHGPLTFSPSAIGAGQPPAMVSGDLAASIISVRSGATAAMVGPTTRYGRIQELGGTMHGHPVMVFHKMIANGMIHKFEREIVTLTPRPYLRPATEDAVASGKVRDAYEFWWGEAIIAGAG